MLNSMGITEYRATFEGLSPSSGLLAHHSIPSSLSSGSSARQSKTTAEQHVPKSKTLKRNETTGTAKTTETPELNNGNAEMKPPKH